MAQHPSGPVGGAGPAQEGLDAGGELVEVEGLGQVVVGAQAQQVDPGPHRVLGGDDDDRQVPGPLAFAQAHEQAVAGDPRQHEVEDDDVDAPGPDQLQGGGRLTGPGDVVPLGGQVGGHEPGQVAVVLDDEDARAALPLPGPPHAAPSQSSAGTLADRRRRSSGCGARRMGHGPSAPDGRGHPMTSSPSGIPLRRRSPARPVPEVISAPPRSTSRSDEPALLTATARNDPAPSIMPVRRPGCAAFGRVPGGPAHRRSTSVVPRLARHARHTMTDVVG